MGNIGSAYGSHRIKHSIVFEADDDDDDDDGYGDDGDDDDDDTQDQTFNCFLGVFQ